MSTETDDDAITDTDRLWIALAVAVLAVAAWANRSAVLAAVVPYGLAAPNRTPFHGDPFNPEAVTGWRPAPGWHLTTAGWIAAAVLAVGAVGLVVCVIAAAAWVRWWRRGGVDAVPIVPATAAVAVLGAAAFGVVLVLVSRLWLAGLVAAVVVAAAWPGLSAAARRQRTVMAFAGRADQVLGHGHPAPGRVRARRWRRDDGGPYPAEIDATCGPGWQHAPGELAELSRYAREVGWPGYEWRYDPMRKRVTGTRATP
ncbi:uncharacterized protein RMCFA_6313 [Mycolicibacterium fortuitum subsp. acetamidolyticum]|uniref:Transmembrane protein n=1 Tax=Mycolicibacterium fortuitum subsp. acetamidolyticum TaxID=144550 RepID=A0A100WXJ5_MYCFO|nr:hypothetical protein [Mycolicibacterium fortuitum]MCV7142902.1 hypothetical protein [Mycolicibacterium fortuitum]GAT06202.1 uncharacterized protein RMCFA_6313 [Mycolicibacterium fortuitum subsp. acetamidolyticum]